MSENLPITWEELQKAIDSPQIEGGTTKLRIHSDTNADNMHEPEWPDFDVKAKICRTLPDIAIHGLTSAAESDKNEIRKIYHVAIIRTLESPSGKLWLREARDEMKKGKIESAQYKVRQCIALILEKAKGNGDFQLQPTLEAWAESYPILNNIAIPTTDQMYLPKSYAQKISEGVTTEMLKDEESLKKYVEEAIKQSLEEAPIAHLIKVQNTFENT